MKRICLGTMITLIYQSRIRRSDTYKSVCGGIFAAYGKKIENYNKELPGHLRSGHDTVPDDLVTAARTMPMDNIDKGVEEYVLPMINHEKKVALFRAIKAVLREDSFTDGALIGRIKGYEKENILNHNSFYDSMLLANVLTYAIASIDNDACVANIGEIDKDYVDHHFIFVMTPERLHHMMIERENIRIDFLFIDEAHKISGRGGRSTYYFKVMTQLRKMQELPTIVLASPNIPNPEIYLNIIPGCEHGPMNRLASRFAPVCQFKYYLDLPSRKAYYFNDYTKERQLCYTLPEGSGLSDIVLKLKKKSR